MKRNCYRAGVIGLTGRGGYGHGLHTAAVGVGRAEVVAVADPDEAGRFRAMAEAGAPRGYADYAEMLARESLDLVCVGPRWLDRREEMVTACIRAGCHVYCEKPFAIDLESADRMVMAADEAGVRIAVAHQAVYLPQIEQLRERVLSEKLVGPVRSVQVYGKAGVRGGGEDLMVLGCHQFNLVRFFLGSPEWMWARVENGGRPLAPADVHEAGEPIGPVAGDSIVAFFRFSGGVDATYRSRMSAPAVSGSPYGIEIIGEQGRLAFDNNRAAIFRSGTWSPWNGSHAWDPLTLGDFDLQAAGNRRAVEDLIDAIECGREPRCGARSAVAVLEMIFGIYASQIADRRLPLPLAERRHPLKIFQESSTF